MVRQPAGDLVLLTGFHPGVRRVGAQEHELHLAWMSSDHIQIKRLPIRSVAGAGRAGREKYFQHDEFLLIHVVLVEFSHLAIAGGDCEIGRRSRRKESLEKKGNQQE